MARSEARLSVEIWNDPDFLALSCDAQRMYMFLISQSDLAHDGVLALRERRWSNAARGLTAPVVYAALTELQDHRFVVIDEGTEELLVRSFLRRDKVYKQPNVLRAAADHLPLVASRTIRHTLAVELARISQEAMPDPSVAIVAEMRQLLPDPTEVSTSNPSRNPPGNPTEVSTPGTPGERGVVTVVTTGIPRTPFLDSPDPEPLALAPLALGQRSRADREFDAFWAVYPRRVAKRAARKAWDQATKRAPAGVIFAGAERYRDQLGRDPTFTAHPATWLNADRWADEPMPRGSPNGARPSTTDQRVGAALALAAEFERLEIEP